MSAAPPDPQDHPHLVAVIPGRLFAPGSAARTRRDVAIEGGDEVIDQAREWQQSAARAITWELGGVLAGTEQDRLYALAGLAASTGERLGLAYTAAVEAALWREAVATTPEQQAAHEMGRRATTELQAHYVIGAGHGLVNATARALALHPILRAELAKPAVLGSQFPPFSEERRDWVSLNPRAAGKLAAVAALLGDDTVAGLADPVVDLATGAVWAALEEHRGKQFHRWRPQSAHLAGVAQHSPWRTRPDGGRELGVGGIVDYRDGDRLADESARVVGAGMRAVAAAMASFGDRWPHASPALGGPRFRL